MYLNSSIVVGLMMQEGTGWWFEKEMRGDRAISNSFQFTVGQAVN